MPNPEHTHQDDLERASRKPAALSRFSGAFCAESQRRLVLIAAILGSAMGFIDGTFVSIAMPAMRSSLGADLTDAQWISNAYMLTLAALILVGGAFGDRFGRARVFVIGIAIFVATSIICAIASGPDLMIAARAAQGVGAALMVPGSLALVSTAYPPQERGRAIGIWAAASAMATGLGPLLGGVLLTWGGPEAWRLLFWVNLPIGIIAAGLLIRAVDQDAGHKDHPLDIPGAILATLGLGLVAFALSGSESAEHGGPSNAVWIGLAGLAALVVFLWWERRSAHPMLPLTLFTDRGFAAANAATFALYFSLSGIFFFLPMTAIAGWGISEAEIALAFVPMTVFMTLLSTRAGALADRIGAGPMIAVGSFVVAIAYALMALLAPAMSLWISVLAPMVVMGLGMSMVVAPLSTAVMKGAPEALAGAASSVNNAMSRIAGLLAVAAAGALVARVYASAGGTASFGIISTSAGHGVAMTTAFAALAWIAAAFALMAAVLAWLLIPRPAQTGS
ncbi:MAG: MFS transporter [Pseudomonadota bacterium]